MSHLAPDWLTEGCIDFEYKKYVLLAYLQRVKHDFDTFKLYPNLPELRYHYHNATQFRVSKSSLETALAKEIVGLNLSSKQLIYKKIEDTAALSEIDSILTYALPRFEHAVQQGETCLQDIEAQLSVSPVGIMPLHTQEGYLFLYRTCLSQTDIYQYRVRLFDPQTQPVVATTYVQSLRKNLTLTFESIKLNLVRQRRDLPNPATYLVESPRDLPLQETLLPLAKNLIVKYLKNYTKIT